MESRSTVLGVLRKARELVVSGQYMGIIEAISSLKDEASGPTRDLAYFAVLETASLGKGDGSLSLLACSQDEGTAIELFDATIKRIVSTLH